MASAASTRSRRIVACIAFALAAIDFDSASWKSPSLVCAAAGTATLATNTVTMVMRSMMSSQKRTPTDAARKPRNCPFDTSRTSFARSRNASGRVHSRGDAPTHLLAPQRANGIGVARHARGHITGERRDGDETQRDDAVGHRIEWAGPEE